MATELLVKGIIHMANKLASVFSRCTHQRSEFILRLAQVCVYLGIHPKTGLGRFLPILAVIGFLSLASPTYASIGAWSYAGSNYPTQAAALAAMRAVSGSNGSGWAGLALQRLSWG